MDQEMALMMIHLADPGPDQNSILMILIIAKVLHTIQMIQREGLEGEDQMMMTSMIHLADPDQAQN